MAQHVFSRHYEQQLAASESVRLTSAWHCPCTPRRAVGLPGDSVYLVMVPTICAGLLRFFGLVCNVIHCVFVCVLWGGEGTAKENRTYETRSVLFSENKRRDLLKKASRVC